MVAKERIERMRQLATRADARGDTEKRIALNNAAAIAERIMRHEQHRLGLPLTQNGYLPMTGEALRNGQRPFDLG
jgi:hypothetical protein